jgi:hypothetical protein
LPPLVGLMEQVPPDRTSVTLGPHESVLHDGWPVLRPHSGLLPAINDPKLLAVMQHWLMARDSRPMPAWRDIDPLQLGPYLPFMWSLRYDRQKRGFIGRLSGEEINAVFGKSLRQTPIEDFFAPQDVPWIHERCLRVIEKPCIVVVTGPVYAYTGHYGLGHRIMLPLGDDHGQGMIGDEVMGATTYSLSPPGMGPEIFSPVEQVSYFHL